MMDSAMTVSPSLIRGSPTRSANARTIVGVGVVGREWMAAMTLRETAIPTAWPGATDEIYLMGNRLQVIGTHAAHGSAQVVQLHPGWDRPDELLICEAMRANESMTHPELPVSVTRRAGRPQPTTICLGDFGPEKLGSISNVLRRHACIIRDRVVIGHRRDGPPEITDHGDGQAAITTSGPSTITVEPDGDE